MCHGDKLGKQLRMYDRNCKEDKALGRLKKTTLTNTWNTTCDTSFLTSRKP